MPETSPANAHHGTAMTGSPSGAVDVLLLGRAFGFAVLVVLLLAAPVWALGLVPQDGVPYFAAGIGARCLDDGRPMSGSVNRRVSHARRSHVGL